MLDVRKTLEVLFTGSRFVFWALAPILLLFALILTVLVDKWTTPTIVGMGGLDLCVVMLVATIYDPRRFHILGRILSVFVFAACVLLLGHEITSGKPWRLKGDDGPSFALMVTVFVGLPCLWYALAGRFGARGALAGGLVGQAVSGPCPNCGRGLTEHRWAILAVAEGPALDRVNARIWGANRKSLYSRGAVTGNEPIGFALVARCDIGGVAFACADRDRLAGGAAAGPRALSKAEFREVESAIPKPSWLTWAALFSD